MPKQSTTSAEQTTEKKANEAYTPRDSKPFTQEQLLAAWESFNKQIENNMPRVYQMLKVHQPVLQENASIALILNNQSQQKTLQDQVLDQLLRHLKTSLENYTLEINISIDSQQTVKQQSYTNSDKFKYLLDKNEKLDELKQRFGLDFE